MCDWAEHQFKLNRPDKDGITEREHLEQVERQIGRRPEALEPPTEFPQLMSHVWSAYCRLSRRRTSGFSGPEPLNPTMVKDWLSLMEETLTSFEAEVIFLLDDIFMEVAHGR